MQLPFGSRGLVTTTLLAGCALLPIGLRAQDGPQQYPQQQYPQQQYPQQPQQYPQQPQQYPQPSQQYPQQQYPQQYPSQPGQYPQQAGQYPQGNYPPPVLLPPQQLDSLVSRIALYPDGLLAQVLTASTYWNELQDAAGWANQHQYLHGDQLAQAISEDRLPFDPSVLALIPFPSVLGQLAQDPAWSQQLGSAVLSQRNDVMDAVQRMRQQAYTYGYLQNNQYERVAYEGPGSIAIYPSVPGAYYVPVYDPLVVYRRPRPGFFAGGAIRFGPAISIGVGFNSFGWRNPGFGWREHSILIDQRPWARTWGNRQSYVAPYAERPHFDGPRMERHDFQGHQDFHDGHQNGHEREHRDHPDR